SSRRRHTRFSRDWSSDVCSSDLPITLSVIYLLIAKRLDLPISGVAVPGHFLVRYDSPFETLWIDPFNEGAILSREDCEELLQARSEERRVGKECRARSAAQSAKR